MALDLHILRESLSEDCCPLNDDGIQDLKYDTPTKNTSFDPDMPIASKHSASQQKVTKSLKIAILLLLKKNVDH